jgi:hypothetical protein
MPEHLSIQDIDDWVNPKERRKKKRRVIHTMINPEVENRQLLDRRRRKKKQ